MRCYVYVAGPLNGSGTQEINIRNACRVGTQLLAKGMIPFIPHLNVLWNMVDPHHVDDWMRWDVAWLDRCDAMLRLPGESPGSDHEIAEARKRGIPVFHFDKEWGARDLIEWWDARCASR